ncbi:MAG: 4Fe-4S dicluster domain-containing protein [candidate division KSB1 bacterium]|nr:4Fe-4S dicluster domain-containing protein [candidate division KSB1 bacterium]MDZ7274300.1 4Fe-4S dicluster domain-containing protein [candidate division KSB1 bacterium]MDZ7287178.1 4Fe-4S dicluster domain-containing protein [candidate division KSB1 bacterium]MDZ7296897.1 4Fe-4S dicluster domain-containing protein [candidate division KSB1 bacterium]MDZ7309325.1 4Fe-4S dicluster domain-containing protein [candidate division KSB1 bacterium]
MKTIEPSSIDHLIAALRRRGFDDILGPKVRDGAIVYDKLQTAADLPAGLTDEQEGGHYRLQARADRALFGYNVGPHSLKKFLFPSVLKLWQARRDGESFVIEAGQAPMPRLAVLGVRACELHALAIQDRVFLQGVHVDPDYRERRTKLFLVAVNCSQAGATCFCASLHTGPKATAGFDLALTEVITGQRHYFVVETGSAAGEEVLNEIPHQEAGEEERRLAEEQVARARRQMGRQLATEGLKELLYRNTENPRWESVANRCLTCANCTMVCPTCFCTTIEEVTDLRGEHAERWRKWDSCFTLDFSYIHGGSVRPSARARYRQWLMHKLATWVDQFGTFGCVGCGRCITWCPVGIDLTAEAQAIRESEAK